MPRPARSVHSGTEGRGRLRYIAVPPAIHAVRSKGVAAPRRPVLFATWATLGKEFQLPTRPTVLQHSRHLLTLAALQDVHTPLAFVTNGMTNLNSWHCWS